MPKKVITVTIEAPTVGDLAKVENAVNAVAKIEGKYAARVSEMCANPKALPALDKNWGLLKTMI